MSASLSPASLARLHAVFARQAAVDLADDLVWELRARGLPHEPLHRVARHLTEYGSARNTVKLGIIVLGECGDDRDRELLLLLGAVEELTLYAVVALMKTQSDPQRAAYELARRVKGWGRIHAVERLEGSDDPEIKAWLLRDRFRNDVMDEYLAHLAATTGDLYTALLRLDMLDHLLIVRHCALTSDRGVAWPEGEPDNLARRYEALLAGPAWRDLVLAHLSNPAGAGTYDFNVALSCAGRLDMPALPQALHHLEREPFNAYAWQWAVNHSDSETITSVITLAMRVLPLDALASGPGNSQGFGPEHAPDRALEAIIISGLDQDQPSQLRDWISAARVRSGR